MLQVVTQADGQDFWSNFELLDEIEVANIEQSRRNMREHLRQAALLNEDLDSRRQLDSDKSGSEQEKSDQNEGEDNGTSEPWWMKFEAARLSSDDESGSSA